MKVKTLNKPTLAYSYRRFSSKNQTDNTSLQRQLEMAQEVCRERGWKLIDLPPDEGVSAYQVADDGEMAANFHKGNLGIFLNKVRKKGFFRDFRGNFC
jgi:resolvase-like protein